MNIKVIWYIAQTIGVQKTIYVWWPNIQGKFDAVRFNMSNNIGDVVKDGAFSINVAYKNIGVLEDAAFGSTVYSFNASDSSSVFAGTTVQAPGLQVLPCIRV